MPVSSDRVAPSGIVAPRRHVFILILDILKHNTFLEILKRKTIHDMNRGVLCISTSPMPYFLPVIEGEAQP